MFKYVNPLVYKAADLWEILKLLYNINIAWLFYER